MNGPEDLKRIPLAVNFAGRDGTTTKDAYIKNGYIERDGEIVRVRPRAGVRESLTWSRPVASLTVSDYHVSKVNVCPRSSSFQHVHCFTSSEYSAGNYLMRLHTIRDNTLVIASSAATAARSSDLAPVCESAASNANVVMFTYDSAVPASYYHTYDCTTYPPTLVANGATAGVTEQIVDAEMKDGYLFALSETGKIYNTNINSNTAWSALNVISASAFFGKALRLIKNGQFLMCFGTKHVEVFYNANNPSGSPLNRYNDVTIPLNIYNANAVLQVDTGIYVVGKMDGSRDGVYFIPNGSLEISKISTAAVDKMLCTNNNARIASLQLFRCENALVITIALDTEHPSLLSNNGSFAFDPAEKVWYVWDVTAYANADSTLTAHNIAYPLSGTVLISEYASPSDPVYYIGYQTGGAEDTEHNGNPVAFEIVTPNYDFNVRFVKSNPRVELIADQDPVVTFNVFTSDDDYQTWDDCGPVELVDPRPELHRLGMSRRRAYKLVRNEAHNVRVEALELTVEVGSG